ncbi:ATP-binding protein [Streptomyces cremeus]|uniref:ATP-binding protein n=1 Tax=Streptomyces cremeus TaxID=66881 RepID=A0ABV5PFE5_STRCM
MHQPATPTHTLCPVADHPDPSPTTRTGYDEADNLAVSLTVPGTARSAGIVRRALAGALHAHRLDRFESILALVVTELMAVAGRLTADADLYVSLRHHRDTLRLIVWDQHPPHADPDATSLCFVRRRRALWLLAEAVEDWGGEWGVDEAVPPHRGIKSWVSLPH